MPTTKESFFNFPLAVTVSDWAQPEGMCNTLAASWLESKFSGKSFWKDDSLQSAPKTSLSRLREEHRLYGDSRLGGDEWVEAKFKNSNYFSSYSAEKTMEPSSIRECHPAIPEKLCMFPHTGHIITIAGAISPHAMASFYDGSSVDFFDPNFGEVNLKPEDLKEWFLRFYATWPRDPAYKNYADGVCRVVRFKDVAIRSIPGHGESHGTHDE